MKRQEECGAKMNFYDLFVPSRKARKIVSSLGFEEPVSCRVIDSKNLDKAYHPKALVFCSGDSGKENKKIARSGVDVLIDPVVHYKRTIDSALMQIAKDNGVVVGISLSKMLEAKKKQRANLMKYYRLLVDLCHKVGTKILLTSGAKDEFQLRKPEQLVSYGKIFGLTKEQARWSLTEIPKSLMERKEAIDK